MTSFVSKLVLVAFATAGIAQAQTTLSACSGMSLGTNGALNGFVPSGTDGWHTDVTSAPVDANSAYILTVNGNDLSGASLHPDFGTVYGIPYNVVDSSSTPNVPVAINLYQADSDITVLPVPTNAVIEGGTPTACTTPTTDQHMIVFDRNKCVAYEYWQAEPCNGSWSAANTALWDFSENQARPYGLTSADAAGLSVFEGLVRYDEIVAGSINHAIRFTASHTKANGNGGYFIAPATHASGNNWSTDNITGMRLRLKPGFDISTFSPTNQIILKAMKQYGMILADNGSSGYFQGTQDSRWDDNDLSALKSIPISAFDVIDVGTTNIIPAGATPGSNSTPNTMFAASNIYDAATAPTGAAPTINSFTASATNVGPGSTVTLSANVSNSSYNYIDNAGFVRNGSVTVSPSATTTYTLTSRNAYGTTTSAVTVTVSPTAATTTSTSTGTTSTGTTSTGTTSTGTTSTGTTSTGTTSTGTTSTGTTSTGTTSTGTTSTGTTSTGTTSTGTTSTGTTSTGTTSTGTTSTGTTSTSTPTVTTNLSLKLTKLSGNTYSIYAFSNSPAAVQVFIAGGNASISGTTLTVYKNSRVTVAASQSAITGYTSATTTASTR